MATTVATGHDHPLTRDRTFRAVRNHLPSSGARVAIQIHSKVCFESLKNPDFAQWTVEWAVIDVGTCSDDQSQDGNINHTVSTTLKT